MKIIEIHVSFGDFSYRYRVGEQIPVEGWSVITSIKMDQADTYNHDMLTYNIFAKKASLEDDEEHLAKKVQGLPVELTYQQ